MTIVTILFPFTIHCDYDCWDRILSERGLQLSSLCTASKPRELSLLDYKRKPSTDIPWFSIKGDITVTTILGCNSTLRMKELD